MSETNNGRQASLPVVDSAPNAGVEPAAPAAPRGYESNRDRFLRAAKVALPVSIDGQSLFAQRKAFSTGSVGYYAQGKVALMVDGQPVLCQVSVTVTVIGSKPTV